jgi:hypothetical protein
LVKEGAPLYRIEKGLFEAAVEQAQDALERSKSASSRWLIELAGERGGARLLPERADRPQFPFAGRGPLPLSCVGVWATHDIRAAPRRLRVELILTTSASAGPVRCGCPTDR